MKYILLIVLFTACKDQSNNVVDGKDSIDNGKTIVVEDSLKKQQIHLETFKKLPPQIDGCSGLFYLESVALKKGDYVFVSDLQSKAFIMIGNELTLLTIKNKNNSEGVINEIYTSGNYQIELLLKMEKILGDELWLYEGELKVSDGTSTIIKKIIGEIGC
jgi:hypothetical protein